jgi:hypothetical protein
MWLRENPKIAKGIAQRQRELMVGSGYLSEAAETCYWRSLIRVWSRTVRTDEADGWGMGVRWCKFCSSFGDLKKNYRQKRS